MDYVLGIDTSCYTTSVAIMSLAGELIADERKMLIVKKGARGLRQSEMIFAHTKNLPEVLEKACRRLSDKNARAQLVGVSAYPRNLPYSYMPVFATGEAFARSISTVGGCPLYALSHQENHLLAGIYSVGNWQATDFLAVHLSGGTTEIVRVRAKDETPWQFDLEIIGGSSDIHAGQFLDRIGVKLGLDFPCGAELERLAAKSNDAPLAIPVAVNGLKVSFAGPETFVAKVIAANSAGEYSIAKGAQAVVAESLKRLLKNAVSLTGLNDILLVGGVASNSFIRQYLSEKLSNIYFPEAKYSPDNAVGAAYAALREWQRKN